MPPVQAPVFVTLGNPSYSFETSFTALVMQPFAQNLDYTAEAIPFHYVDPNPALSPSWRIHEIRPDFHFGFDLGIAGMFHSAQSSLMVNWERYHSPTDSHSNTVSSTAFMTGPFFEIGPDASLYKKSKGTTDFHFDEVNLDYGTFVHFGDRLHMNLFAGVSFARILQHRFTTFSDLSESIVRTIRVPSKFLGAGPQMGLDFTYKLAKGLQLVGNSKTSLFVGHFKNSTKYSTASSSLVGLGEENPNFQSTSVKNRGGVVPGLEAKLGLAYEFLFSSHYMVKLEAGYQAQIYINSIRSIDMGSQVAGGTLESISTAALGVYARTFERTVSDFAIAGPYATCSFGF